MNKCQRKKTFQFDSMGEFFECEHVAFLLLRPFSAPQEASLASIYLSHEQHLSPTSALE